MKLPKQLQNEEFSFIRLKGKDPSISGSGWQKQIHRFQEAEALLQANHNYGVMTGHGGLIILDADADAVSDVVDVSRLANTFTVKTGSGKKHYYYICPELAEKKIILNDKLEPSRFTKAEIEEAKRKEKEPHYGEILTKNFQGVGPGSIHPDTKNYYEVEKDLPILTVSKEELLGVIVDFLPPVVEYIPKIPKNSPTADINITDVINVPRTCTIKHPIHGANNGGNLNINIEKNVWRCFRCESGGGPLSLIAVMEGIIDCSQAIKGGLTGKKFLDTLAIAEKKYGLKREQYQTSALILPDSNIEFLVDLKKNPIQNTENICRVLRHHKAFKNKIRYDNFKNTYEVQQDKKWRPIEDNDAVVVQTEISILFPCFAKVGKDMVYDAIIKVSKENAIDSATDFIRSLVWDKKERLDTWLSNVYGVEDNIYHKAVASNWIKGLVKRIVEPGCKFDYVLVLEGEQGSRKSSSLYTLGGDWHVETAMSTDSKDFFMQFAGKAIVEFSEGETLSRTEVKRMKAIITMQSDKYRPPYSRVSQDFPRRCVFAMTTNQTEYLKDETGNRRWLPVRVAKEEADTDWLLENREQLFAEAYHRVFNLKEKTYEFPKEETLREQNDRRIGNPQEELVTDWYFSGDLSDYTKRFDGITANQVYRQAICGNMVTRPMDKFMEMAITDILKNKLKLKRKRIQNNGIQSWKWVDESITGVLVEDKEVEQSIWKD